MCLNKVIRAGYRLITGIPLKKWFLYLLITVVPLMFYPISINGIRIDIRKIREICVYSFAVIILSFMQKNKWLSLFVIWCVANWWLNFFSPPQSYVGLTNIFSYLAIYISLLYCFKNELLSIDTVLKTICGAIIFQFIWMLMQKFTHFDPVFYPVNISGDWDTSRNIDLVGWSGNTSILAVFFSANLFLLLQYFRIKKIPILFFAILSTSVIFLKSFTSMLCFSAGFIFYFFCKYLKNKLSKAYLIFWGIIIFLSTALCALYIKLPNFDRLPIWQKLIKDGMNIRPVVGLGISTFKQLLIIDKTDTPWAEAHNDYLQILLELGSVGLFLFIAFLVKEVIEFFRNYKTEKQIGMASCLIAFLASGISLFPMHLSQLSFYAIVIFSCLKHSYETAEIKIYKY